MTFTLHHPFTFEYDGSQLMTGIIAGVYTTFARVAIDSYFGTAAGDESARGLKMVLPHVSAVLAGRGSVALFWMIVQDVSEITVPFDGLARLLPDLIGDTTHGESQEPVAAAPGISGE